MLRTIHLALLAIMAAALTTPTQPAHARAGDWKLVGSEAISLRENSATIGVGRNQGALSSIQLRAWGKSFYLRTISVVFGNGERQVVSVYDLIQAGGASRAFALDGGRRNVREVRLRYRKGNSSGYRRSLVEVFGREAARAQPKPKPRPRITGKWSNIGKVFLRTTESTKTVNTNGGGTRLLVKTSFAGLEFKNIVITFGNGERQVVQVRDWIDSGSHIGPIDLNGGYRNIRSVRANLNGQRQSQSRDARIEVLVQGERRRPAVQPIPRGWKSLDVQNVDLRDDRFAMPVGRGEGLVRSIRIRSRDRAVRVRRVRIVFGNGATQNERINERISAGGQTSTIDLDGESRYIREVIVRTEGQNRRRNTRLEVIGEIGRRAAPALPSIPRGWKVLDSHNADLRDSRFALPVGRNEGRFSSIRLRNRDNPFYLRSMRIEFGNGQSQVVTVNSRLEAGERTRVIPLDGRGPRFIRQVILRIAGQNRRANSRIEVVGRVANVAPPPPRPPSGGAGGWKTVGSQTFKLRSKNVNLIVGRNRGKLSHIRFRADGRPVSIRRIVIVYGNGDQHEVQLSTRVNVGTMSAPIKLSGSGRFIERVFVVLKRKRFSDRRATLHVLGRSSGQGSWISLGQRRADMFQPVRDTFVVGRNRGRFSKIKLRALRHHVKIYSATVTFGNGEVMQLPFSGRLRDGVSTPAFDLPTRGRGRYIKSVQVLHKSKINFRGEGATEVLLLN